VLSLLASGGYANTLAADLNQIIQKELPGATVGVVIKDLTNHKVLYAHNAKKLLSPASGVKIFTAAASLYQLGADYTFNTRILKKNKNIYIQFSGDPSLSSTELSAMINQLKKGGIHTIQGDIIIDGSKYQLPNYAAGINYDDLGWYYVAPSSAIIINGNKETYDFISPPKLGQPVKINAIKPHTPLKLINNLVAVSFEQQRNHCSFNIAIKPNNTLRLYGCMPRYKDKRTLSLAIPEPALYAKDIVSQALKESGISLKGQIKEGKTPPNAKTLVVHPSKKMIDLVAWMLKESDNLYADSLTKMLGVSLTKQGTYKQGAYAIKKVIAQHSKIKTNELDISDGQGTRYNLISPNQMVLLLSDIYRDTNMRGLITNALPLMGVSGSLQWRMRDSSLRKRVIAKTGTMHDISSLSGYFMTKSAQPIAFSIIINGVHQSIGKAKRLEEKLLMTLSKHVD
tara:strand:+ start:386 stop:1750 length:1365 start_codon:yes stop_codon:yes gene_type:complete